MRTFQDRFVAVTGGSSGIGAAVASAFAAEGAAVAAYGRRFTAPCLHWPPAAGTIAQIGLDVTDEAAVEAQFAAMPWLDVLVCSAGVGTFGPITRASVVDLRAMLEVHVIGSFLCARAALRRMREQRRGHIVIVSSVSAQRAFADCGGYTAAKAGQLGLTRVLAEEARPFGVRVTAFLPGATDTPIWDDRPGFDRRKKIGRAHV